MQQHTFHCPLLDGFSSQVMTITREKNVKNIKHIYKYVFVCIYIFFNYKNDYEMFYGVFG